MGRSTLRHFTCCRAIPLFAGILISGALGCTSVKRPNFGTQDGAASGGAGGSGDAGLGSETGGGGANGDAGSFSDGKIATDGAKDGASPGDSPASGGGSDGSAASGGSIGIGGSTGTGGSIAIGGSSGGSIAIGGSTVSGGPDAAPDVPVLPPDGSSPLPIGSACSASTDCALGNCVDGVCCEIACSGCNACKQTQTGKKDGTCAPVISGQDPHSTCADETATKQCGNDGTCDGAGACRKVSTSHICAPASCSADNKTFTPATTCDGAGACTVATPQGCGAFQCATSGCLKACSAQADCGAGNYCNIPAGATAGTCAATKANGVAATQTFECTSGVVADGVCCNLACTGCSACTKALNGQTDGQCLSVPNGQVAHSACTASGTTCGLDGYCDGANKCRYPAAGTSCGTSCTGSTLTTKTCDGAGTCGAATSTCGGGLLCGATTCKTTCTVDTDCVTSDYCSSGTCTAKLGNGAPCSTSNQCPTGNTCVEGVCCSSACGITCKSCLASKTGGANGTCAFVTAGTTCGAGQVCSAAGGCGACNQNATCPPPNQPCKTGTLDCSTGVPVCNATGNYPASQSCGPAASCNASTKQATPAQMCDGNGNCPNVTAVNCPYGCNGTICANAKTNGTPCSAGSECASGKCIDGVCCTASGSSCPTCQACNLNGSGTCSNKASGAADTACPASTANCMAGGCDGAGHCTALQAGTSCGTNSCTNGAEGVGQWKAPTATTHTCNGSTGSAACQMASGCSGNRVCAPGGTDCKTTCTKDSDCVDGYHCSSGTCVARKANGSCSSDLECQSRVCLSSTCVECEGWIVSGAYPNRSDECPHDRPLCVNNACVSCVSDDTWFSDDSCYLSVFDPPGTVKDGSVLIGEGCGNRGFPAINARGDFVCSGCNSTTDCPPGQVCASTQGGVGACRNRGGQPCVSNNCIAGSCGDQSPGVCPLAGAGAFCDYSLARPAASGCQGTCTQQGCLEVSSQGASTNVDCCQ